MRDFLESKLGQYFFYTLLYVCAFIVNWALIGWLSYDFNFMETQARFHLLLQIFASLLWFVLFLFIWHVVLDN